MSGQSPVRLYKCTCAQMVFQSTQMLGRELLDVLFFSFKSIVIPSDMNQSGCLVAKHVQGHPVEMHGRTALIRE